MSVLMSEDCNANFQFARWTNWPSVPMLGSKTHRSNCQFIPLLVSKTCSPNWQLVLQFWAISFMLLAFQLSPHAQTLAFPGAEGFGRLTSGGRGGLVVEVTNLNDAGSGSLRAAIECDQPRTVVFRTSGTIALESELIIEHGHITIAGQTAPGDGICLKNYPLIISGDNVIIRYLRIRPGDEKKFEGDAISCIGHRNIIIDHCSFSWGIDEVASVYDNENCTVQWCIISESLNRSYHHKGDHGYGGIWGGKGASFHHNLLAHHSSRSPRFHGSRTHGQPRSEIVDFQNNVIYNWGANSSYGGEGGSYNLVANYYKAGPATKRQNRIVEPWDGTGRWYVADNYVAGFPIITKDNWAGGVQGKFWKKVRIASPVAVPAIVRQPAEQAYQLVLENAGAVLPKRDAVDARIIEEVKTGSATFGGSWGQGSGIIDSQRQVGGWPELKTANVPIDTDHDGMPDDWELAHGLDPRDPDDRNLTRKGAGDTNLEAYLNHLVVLP